MKRILMMLFALVVTISVTAQEKKGETDKAKKITAEMTEVLELNEATSATVHELQKEKFTQLKVANQELKEDKEALRTKKKEINDAFKAEMAALVGKDKMKTWSAHVKANKSKKEKKK